METTSFTSIGVARHDQVAAELAFEAVGLAIGDRKILDDLSFRVHAGEILCLLGPSGSGKTTLLRIAAGVEALDTGRVLLDGQILSGPGCFVAPEKRGVGLMFQDFALFPHMTLLDNVRFGIQRSGGARSRAAALKTLERVGLAHAAGQYPHVLSGGEQQRVALARALAPFPRVLLMDEPFSGLDSRLRDDVRTSTLEVLRDAGTTTVMVTHDAEEAMRMGDRIALLRDGRLIQVGTPEDLYRSPVNLFAANFFSELNVLPGLVQARRIETALGPVADSPLSDGTAVTVAIRPSALNISDRDKGVRGRVVGRRFLGNVDLVSMSVDGLTQPLQARVRGGVLPACGEDVFVSVDLQDIIVFEGAIAEPSDVHDSIVSRHKEKSHG